MRVLDRYVLRELTFPFLLGLALFTFLLLVDKIFDLVDLILNKGVPPALVGLLLLYILPAFLVLTIPMAFLLAILVAFGRLSADMEIVALKASGVGLWRLLRPVLGYGLVAAVATGYLMFEAVPRSNYAFKALFFEILRRQAAVGIRERVFNDDFGDLVIYVEELAVDQVGLRRILVADERKPDEMRIVTAREGRLISDEVNRRVTLRLLGGTVHETPRQSPRQYRQIRFSSYDLTLPLDNPLARAAEAPKGDREMTVGELRAEVARARGSGGNPNPFLVELHKKYAIPAASLIFAILGVPLGIRAHRAGRWAAFVAVLPVFLFYHVALSLGETLADRGRIPPWLAMWGPNGAMGLLALGFLRAAVRERPLVPASLVAAMGGWWWRLGARHRQRGHRRRPAPGGRVAPRSGPRRVPRSNALHVLDRYLTREFLTLFGYGLALATVVVVVADLMTTLERYLRLRTPLVYVLLHFAYRTPGYVYQGLHLVVLMAAILLFLGLARANELTALKASGVSLYRVSLPVFVLAGLVTLGSVAFQEVVLPVLNQRAVEVDEVWIKRRTLPQLRKRSQIWYRSREADAGVSRIYHIDLLDPVRAELNGVVILELGGDFGVRRRWDTRSMRWRETDQAWELQDAVLRRFDPGRPDQTELLPLARVQFPERFADFAQVPRAPDVMNYAELREHIARLEASGHQVDKYRVDLHAKLATPAAHLIMVLVGIPFALQSPRGGRVIGIALCLALGLGYFLVHSAGLALGRGGILSPVVAAWAANALFGLLGGYFFLRART